MENKALNESKDEILQTENGISNAKLMDELNKQMLELTRANAQKQNVNLQLEIEAENLKKSNEKPKPEAPSSDSDEEENKEDDKDEEKSKCEFCGSEEHDSHYPHLELT